MGEEIRYRHWESKGILLGHRTVSRKNMVLKYGWNWNTNPSVISKSFRRISLHTVNGGRMEKIGNEAFRFRCLGNVAHVAGKDWLGSGRRRRKGNPYSLGSDSQALRS